MTYIVLGGALNSTHSLICTGWIDHIRLWTMEGLLTRGRSGARRGFRKFGDFACYTKKAIIIQLQLEVTVSQSLAFFF